MSPANTKPVRPWTPDRHIDVNADLHYFFDWLVAGKRVLDVGAGLGKSKARIRHSQVTTYDPSPAVTGRVDASSVLAFAPAVFDVVTAFEVIEHVENDRHFLQDLDALATQAVFLTTPNWGINHCQSADHYREYTHVEWEELICTVWSSTPTRPVRYWWGAFFKDAEGGWGELLSPRAFRRHAGLKHLVLVDKGLSAEERAWLARLEDRPRG